MPKTPKEKPEKEEKGAKQPRLSQIHGVKPDDLVEAITEEELVEVNDAECKHVSMTRDPSETEFNAFTCDNPKCGIVVLVDKI